MTNDYVTTEQFNAFLREETDHHKRAEAEAMRHTAKLESIHKTLYGNGQPGWDEMLRNIQLYIDDQKCKDAKRERQAEDKAKKEEENRTWYLRLVVTLVVTNAVGLLTAAFMWFVKILPLIDALNK